MATDATSEKAPVKAPAAPPAKPGLLARLRARLANRPDSEHEQALVRLIVGSVLFVYLLPKALTDPAGQQGVDQLFLSAMVVHILASTAIFAWIVAQPGVSHLRRVLGALLDTGSVTFFMWQTGAYGAPLFLVFIWYTQANGVRFGPRYLLVSLALNIIGFSIVLAVTPFWQQYFGPGVGMMVGMVALALYVLSLVKRLSDALAKAESANLAKRRFISVVSHEMRTPLNAVIGMTELLRDSHLNREQGEMVNTMGSAGRVLLGLIEDVLDFSKIEAGKLGIEHIDFDLHAMVNSTCRILQPQAETKGLELLVSIMPEVPPALRGDPHHIRQILINLVGNAVKFTEKGSITVHVSLLTETDAAVKVKFSVRDTGIGITPEAQARIFESFVQEDQSTTRRFGGTGLGTTIAKQLVELMGGRMGLESAVGLGSTFWFELELPKQPDASNRLFEDEAVDSRVLVVGFGSDDREFLQQTMKGWGVTGVFVSNAVEGGHKIVSESGLARPFRSVMVLASTLEDAKRSLSALRRGAGAGASAGLPIILCTQASGAEGAAQRLAAISAGFSAALELPIQKRLLFNVLHSVTAVEDTTTAGGVVQLRDYLKKRSGTSRRYRIVVADDSATNRQVLGKILERGGHAVTLVDDGEFVLDALETAEYDIAILDRNMPGMGGVETLRALRAMGFRRDRFPVIILSADVTSDTREECDEAGANAFLPKPVEASRLLEAVAELCGNSAEARGEAEESAPQRPAHAGMAAAQAGLKGPLNLGTLQLLEGLGTASGFLERLIKVFIGDNRQIVEKMERCIAARDYAEFRRQLHAMKGSAASIGAEQLAMACSAMNGLTDAEMGLQQRQLAASIKTEFERAEAALQRYLEDRHRTTG